MPNLLSVQFLFPVFIFERQEPEHCFHPKISTYFGRNTGLITENWIRTEGIALTHVTEITGRNRGRDKVFCSNNANESADPSTLITMIVFNHLISKVICQAEMPNISGFLSANKDIFYISLFCMTVN